jgi:ketosteroid isomerase-like protein
LTHGWRIDRIHRADQHRAYGSKTTTHLRRTPNLTKKEQEMNDAKKSAEDLAILEQLNLDYNTADQASDAKRFSEFLAEDFIVQTPGVTRNREEYLEYIAKPRPFKDLALLEARIRILGDVALIHGRARYTMLSDGAEQEALYTDAYQKREGTWVCVSACAIAPGA